MEWSDEDFKDLKFNPIGLPVKQTVVSVFPEIGRREAFNVSKPHSGVSRDKIHRWILLVYQHGSPLLTINSPIRRKVEAAKLVGFPMQDENNFDKDYLEAMMGGMDHVNAMIVDFCRMQRNPDFAELMVYEDSFHKELEKLQAEENAIERSRILANIKGMKERITDLRMSLLQGDENQKVFEEVMKQAEFERLELMREDIADKLQKKETPVKIKPYGDYSFPRAKDRNKGE
jgi:hypothetical protein